MHVAFLCQELYGNSENNFKLTSMLIGCPVANAKWNASDKLNQQCSNLALFKFSNEQY